MVTQAEGETDTAQAEPKAAKPAAARAMPAIAEHLADTKRRPGEYEAKTRRRPTGDKTTTSRPLRATRLKNRRPKQKSDAVQSVAGPVETVDRESKIGRPAD